MTSVDLPGVPADPAGSGAAGSGQTGPSHLSPSHRDPGHSGPGHHGVAVPTRRRRLPVLGSVAYVVTGLVPTTLAFAFVVTLLSVGLTLCVTPLAVPAMIATFAAARAFADVERHRAALVTGVAIPRPRYRTARGLWWRRLKAMLTDSATYRDMVFCGLAMTLSIITFVLVVTFWATTLGALSAPLWMPSIPGGAHLLPTDRDTSVEWLGRTWFEHGWTIKTFRQGLTVVPIGVVLLPLTVWLTRGCARVQLGFARVLLRPGRNERLRERVDALTVTRADALQAQAAELRRIERDLHDGAQSHLVALAMDLGMARDKLDHDPDAARELVGQAHEEAKRTLAELRNLARGIAPAVLTDRGLRAALDAVAGRCPVPVVVDTDALPADLRLPVDVETAAYFVVSEALTNVAKHSHAQAASVHLSLSSDRRARRQSPRSASSSGPSPVGTLVIEVRDDGVGGVDASHGSGVAGLRARVAAHDGDLDVTSPPGGPTLLRATVPVPAP